jgi:hypothetical protein
MSLLRNSLKRVMGTSFASFAWPEGSARRRDRHYRPTLELLESRLAPVVGANAIPNGVAPGGPFDGVVQLTNGKLGSGALLSDRTHVLTAAHVLADAPGSPTRATNILFELARNDAAVRDRQVPITLRVPPNGGASRFQILHPTWNGNSTDDIALVTLPDQQAGPQQATSRLVAPYYGPNSGYQLFTGNALGQVVTLVGYGQTGTGNNGQMSDEVQQVQIQNPVAGATFTLSLDGQVTGALAQNATAAQVAAALGGLANIGPMNIAVSTAGLGPNTWNVRFIRDLGSDAVNLLVGATQGGGMIGVNRLWAGSDTTGTKRSGQNQLDRADPARPNVLQDDFDNGLPAQNFMGNLGLGAREALDSAGDSGGPVFVQNAGQLQIAAEHTFGAPTNLSINQYIRGDGARITDSSFGSISGETLVAPYINSFIAPNQSGLYDLVLDMNFQVLGRDGVTEPVTITARRNGRNLELVVNDAAAPAYSGVYFSGNAAVISSLTIRGATTPGSQDNDTFIVQGNLRLGPRQNSPITLDGGSGNNNFAVYSDGTVVPNGNGAITVVGRGGDNELEVHDEADTGNNVSYSAARSVVSARNGDGKSVFTVNYAGINSGLEMGGGTGYNQWTAFSTPDCPTTLNTGTGPNDSTVFATTGPLTINGQRGVDNVRVGNGGGVQDIRGNIVVTNTRGLTSLSVDDSPDPDTRIVVLTADSLTGLAPAVISWVPADINNLNISGGSGGNVFTVRTTPPGVRAAQVTLNTGSGNDAVDVQATQRRLNINGQAGRDQVNIGNRGNAQGVKGDVLVTNAAGSTTLTIDDSADGTARNATLNSVSLTGLTPGDINWVQAGLRALAINGGSGGNSFLVYTTPSNGVPVRTTLRTGGDNDTVNVRAAAGPLTIDGQAGDDRIAFFNFKDSATIDGGPGNNTIEVAQGTLATSQVPFTNVQNLVVAGGSTLAVDTDVSTDTILVRRGTLALQGGIPTVSNRVEIQPPGILTGTGQINGSVLNGGQVLPAGAGAVGRITVQEDYVQAATGTLNLDLQGPEPGTQSDNLEVGHAVQLNGVLNLTALAGFNGDTFVLVSNRGNDDVAGIFTGLPEGALVTVGGREFQITYKGGEGNDVVLHPAGQIGANTTVGSSLNPSVYGQSVTFTASVTAVSPGSGTPTGTVQFLVDGSNFGAPVPLTSGLATGGSLSTLTAGTHIITAAYSGDGTFSASTGSFTQTVTPAPLTITADDKSKLYGEALPPLTASYSGFVNGDTPASLTAQPTLTTTGTDSSPVGSYPITADGAVDPNYAISYVAGTLTVNPAGTAVSVTANKPTSVFGEPIYFTASVQSLVPGAGTPTGTVAFKRVSPDGTTVVTFGTAPLDATGTAVLVMDHFVPATATIFAVYLGDSNFTGSTSATITHIIDKADTTLALSASSTTVVVGQPVDFTATLDVVPPGAFVAPPTGTITLYDTFQGVTTILAVIPVGGSTTFPSFTTPGTHVITAVYSGDSDFNGSTSDPITITVLAG